MQHPYPLWYLQKTKGLRGRQEIKICCTKVSDYKIPYMHKCQTNLQLEFTLWYFIWVLHLVPNFINISCVWSGSYIALCVIFTILVSFSHDNALFASKAKINVFRNFFEWSGPEGASRVKKKFPKTLILAFEVIVQPPKTHFSTFSKVQKQKKSETKIMKITHSVELGDRQTYRKPEKKASFNFVLAFHW